MIHAERDYVLPAFEALKKWMFLLPTDVQRKILIAKSVIESHGSATGDELKRELGEDWVLARRTKNIIERYGEDVRCYTPKQYEAAERRAIEARF